MYACLHKLTVDHDLYISGGNYTGKFHISTINWWFFFPN